MSAITGFFRSDRPVWQKAMVSTFAVVLLLITALAINMSPLVRDYEAMAMEAALNNPEVQQIIEYGEIDADTLKIDAVFDTENGIRYFISIGEGKIAIVDLSKWIFTSQIVDVINVETVPVTDASKQKLVDIASNDSEIKALLDKGVPIYMYYFDYIPAYMSSSSFSNFVHETGGGSPFCVQDEEIISDYWTELTARFWMEYEGNTYFVYIDMMTETIISTSCWPVEKEDKITIAKELVLNDPQVQALLGNAEIDKDKIRVVDSILPDGYAAVVIKFSDDGIIIANISNGTDGSKTVEIIENEVVPVTDDKKQEIIGIVSTDPELKEIFDKGVTIYEYYFDYIPAYLISDGSSGSPQVSIPVSIENRQIICDELAEYTIRCQIEFSGTIYIFSLDMLNKLVDWKDSIPAWFYHEMETMATTATK